MNIKTIASTLTLVAALSPIANVAAENANGQNYLVPDNQSWPTGLEQGFYQSNGSGVSNIINGPTETAAINCHGAGFWGVKGNRGEGICLHGSGGNTYTSTYKIDQGSKEGRWEIVGGTGKYKGIGGQGTFVLSSLPGKRAISTWQGEINLANQALNIKGQI